MTSASAWDKFLLLSWKNWIIQIRHPVQTIFEILVPVIVCALVTVIRGYVSVTEFKNSTNYLPIDINYIHPDILANQQGNLVLAYSPENPLLQSIVENAVKSLNFTDVVAQKNSTELENYAIAFTPFASIEFDDSLKVGKSIISKKLPQVFKNETLFPFEYFRTY
jgi:ATP-binding cassette, subfamily A (ABC1), member 3